MAEVIGVGLLGCGIVGSAVARILDAHVEEVSERVGARLEVRRVAVKDLGKKRDTPLDPAIFTTKPSEVVSDPEVGIVVEVMGGIEPARTLMIEAMGRGKHVVTANKELLSTHGKDLFDAAEHAGVDLYFEASVAGGIPIIRPLKESLAGERITRVMGIVNGTTNYILTRMSEEALDFNSALADATRLGYSELDPTADIEGFDAAAKLAILSSIAFNARVVASDVYREGISSVTARDIAYGHQLGYEVKLLAIGEKVGGEVSVRVHPAMIPKHHPLASVRENLNAVFVEGEQVGELMFLGRGAGGPPTGTSVVGDLVEVARNMVSGGRGPGCTCYRDDARIRSMDQTMSQHYILLEVFDRPGVLAEVARSFADHNVSIKSLWQEGYGDEASLVMVTHSAVEHDVRELLRSLEKLESVDEVAASMRVQSSDE
ncbi:MAG TPA: homoserine dehydrogenase [Actinomycetota bacterium]|nr:homoserine dehydrogenase [Actinomycetota bacterium]